MTGKLFFSLLLCLLCVRGNCYTISPSSPSVCIGATVALTSTLPGGTWTSTNTAVAVVDAATGVVTGVSPGMATIVYSTGKHPASVIVTVSACCLSNSLIINTGYDPVAMTAAPGQAGDNVTPIADPKWIVSYISPDALARIAAFGSTAVLPGNKANVLDAEISPYPTGSWIVNTTASPSSWISAQNAHGYGTDEHNALDLSMILSRPFSMCADDSVRIDVMIANYNYMVSANIDSTIDLPDFAVQAAAGTNPNEHANHEEFHHFITLAAIGLPAGPHQLNVVIKNYNFPESTIYNPTGLNLYGRLYSVTGAYSLVREDDSTCMVGSCVTGTHVTTGSAVVYTPGRLLCFPNPTNGTFTLSGVLPGTSSSKEAKIEVVDMMGKVVYTSVATMENGGINKVIALGNDVSNGVYLVKITSDNTTAAVRFSVSR